MQVNLSPAYQSTLDAVARRPTIVEDGARYRRRDRRNVTPRARSRAPSTRERRRRPNRPGAGRFDSGGADEELEGHRTQDEPGPKTDRIAELIEKLDGLESETSGEAGERLARAREACVEYQKSQAQDDET
ncbi:hypothetical protein ACFQMM_17310 [Saliphagus sp. GCM10025308]